MATRITISRDKRGHVQIHLNEAGRDALVRALQMLSREDDHIHLAPEEFDGEVPTREVSYQEGDEVMAWGKILFRPDDWDARHFPHVLTS